MKRGDIVENKFVPKGHKYRYLLYSGANELGHSYVTYDGHTLDYGPKELKVVGHMDEFDAFMDAIKRLKDYGNPTI